MGPFIGRKLMNDQEKLWAYEELVRQIIVHAEKLSDVHRAVRNFDSKHPDILRHKPYYMFIK